MMAVNEFGHVVPARVEAMARQQGCVGGTRYVYVDGEYNGKRPVASIGCQRPTRFQSVNFEMFKARLVETWVAFRSPSYVIQSNQSHEHQTFEGVIDAPPRPTDTEAYVPEEDPLLGEAVKQTGLAVDAFLREFIRTPFLHRVEHSLHSALCDILRVHLGSLAVTFPIADGTALTQLVHKEWPAPFPRSEKRGRRGNFDIAVLSPKLLASCKTIQVFRRGRLAAPIAIEMWLDYDAAHLARDARKLLDSQLFQGYLVHLSRGIPSDPNVEQILTSVEKRSGILTAYMSWNTTRTVYKLVNSPKVEEFFG